MQLLDSNFENILDPTIPVPTILSILYEYCNNNYDLSEKP